MNTQSIYHKGTTRKHEIVGRVLKVKGRTLTETENVKPLSYKSKAVKGAVWNGSLLEVKNADG